MGPPLKDYAKELDDKVILRFMRLGPESLGYFSSAEAAACGRALRLRFGKRRFGHGFSH